MLSSVQRNGALFIVQISYTLKYSIFDGNILYKVQTFRHSREKLTKPFFNRIIHKLINFRFEILNFLLILEQLLQRGICILAYLKIFQVEN